MARSAAQERKDEKRILKLRKNTQRAERAYDRETSQIRSMKAANARLVEQGKPKRYTSDGIRRQRIKVNLALGRWKERRQKYEAAVESEAERDRAEDAARNPKATVRAFGGARVTIATLAVLNRARSRGWSGQLNGPLSGQRTYGEQARLYALYLAGQGNPAWPPSSPRANHMTRNMRRDGTHSVDGSDAGTFRAKSGWVQPFPGEKWHSEPNY